MAAMLVAAGIATGMPETTGAQTIDEDQRLATLSREAESSTQHKRVAGEFRDRAKRLDTEASRLDRTARRLESKWFPNEYKLPPPQRPGYRERQRAAEARRTARESRALAQRHEQMAIELHAEP
jgi:hypothetical protein